MIKWMKEKWLAFRSWVRDSEIIAYARAQVVIGLGLLADHFYNIPWEQIADGTWSMTVQAWMAVGVLVNGLVLEPLRKWRAEDM